MHLVFHDVTGRVTALIFSGSAPLVVEITLTPTLSRGTGRGGGEQCARWRVELFIHR